MAATHRFKILATNVVAAVVLSACSSEMGRDDATSTVPPSASSDTGLPAPPPVTDDVASSLVVVSQDGESPADAMSTIALGIDELPAGTAPLEASSDIGFWLLDSAAAFHVVPSATELDCLAALELDADETGEAIEGIGDGWARAAGCLAAENVAAIEVMRAMDVALADASDEQYICIESAMNMERTPVNLERALIACSVDS